jgi:hypothetical protein
MDLVGIEKKPMSTPRAVLVEFCHSFALFDGPSTACRALWVLLIVEG